MKKLLVVIAMLAAATALFAESVSCESEKGKCTFELSGGALSSECECSDGTGFADSEIPGEGDSATLPTKEECEAELEDACQNSDGFMCENEAGECTVSGEGDYDCKCFGTKDFDSGSTESSMEACNTILVQTCGTEAATIRKICTNSEIFNICVSYTKTVADTCIEPVSEEEIEAMLDVPAKDNATASAIIACCFDEYEREEAKADFDCINAAGSCEDQKCCETCNIIGYAGSDPEDGKDSDEDNGDNDVVSPAPEDDTDTTGTDADDTDAADTDAPAPAESAAPEDSADGNSGTKEESKSDGCSMLFI